MKRNTISNSALTCLIGGLLIVATTLIISHYHSLPDSFRGFSTGVGIALEFIAIVIIRRSKENSKCMESRD